jgi:hypothetical protein
VSPQKIIPAKTGLFVRLYASQSTACSDFHMLLTGALTYRTAAQLLLGQTIILRENL